MLDIYVILCYNVKHNHKGGIKLFTIKTEFSFEAAHILDESYSKECQSIHGHSYRVETFYSSEDLNDDGMVVDFKLLKNFHRIIQKHFDHTLIISETLNTNTSWFDRWDNIVIMKNNPTAENMAFDIFNMLQYHINEQNGAFNLIKIKVWETNKSYAEYSHN